MTEQSRIAVAGLLAILLAILLAGQCAALAGDPQGLQQRRHRLLADWAQEPPRLSLSNPRWRFARTAANALARYALHEQLGQASTDLADAQIIDLHANVGIPADDLLDNIYHFALEMPLLTRIWMDPALRSRMSPQARDAFKDMMWTHMYRRSATALAGADRANVWHFTSPYRRSLSENKAYAYNSCFYLHAMALMDEPDYGPDRRLADGQTLQAHYLAWQAYWRERLRQNGREGLLQETASANYMPVTLVPIYNIRDFGDPVTADLAEKVLHLFYADEAHDFQPRAGIAGASMTRCKERHDVQPSRYGMAPFFYMYGWHDIEALTDRVVTWQGHDGSVRRPAPYVLAAAVSSYQPPPIVRAIAQDAVEEPYFYVSRRYGRWHGTYGHALPSHIRRTTWRTSDYSMGGMTYDSSLSYTALHRSTQAFAVICNDAQVLDDGVNVSRLLVNGVDLQWDGQRYYNPRQALTSVVGRDVMIVKRDLNQRDATTLQITLAAGELEDNARGLDDDGWVYTRAGGAMLAIRLADGGFRRREIDLGGLQLLLNDPDAPIVIQAAQASRYDHADDPFGAFVAEVANLPFTYADETLTFTSLAGDQYHVRAASHDLPAINGQPVELNPPNTYESPYIRMTYGTDVVTIRYPGFEDLVLDFSYPGQP